MNKPFNAETARFLESANILFHEAYAEARDRAARSVPILIVLGDELILHHGKERHAWSFAEESFDQIKVAAHVLVVAAGLRTLSSLSVEQREEHANRRAALREMLDREEARLPSGGVESIGRTLALSRVLLASNDAAAHPPSAVTAESKELLERLTSEAAQIRLQRLHDRVGAVLTLLDAESRKELRVVVAGDHQARRRSLGMQYFERRIPPASTGEPRVTYGESVTDEDQALALVGAQIVDRALANGLFGDPTRMQEDLLGDATQAHLAKLDLPAIA